MIDFAMIQSKLSQYCSAAINGNGAPLHLARRLAAVATAFLLISAAFIVLLFSGVDARAGGLFGTCPDAGDLAVLPSPLSPWRGAPLHVVFAAEKPVEGELSLIAPDGSVAARSRGRYGGPPYFWFAEVASPAAGTWHAQLAPAGCSAITREIAVSDAPPPRPRTTPASTWPLRNSWNRATENLYSAWIEKLFDAPLDAEPSWPALYNVLRDRSRNFLFNYLGAGEDEVAMTLRPDCADLVYFLRAYFAFKMGLPFGYSNCSRGGGGKPPKCFAWSSIQGVGSSSSDRRSAEPQPTKISVDVRRGGSGEAARAWCVVRPLFAGGRGRRSVRIRACVCDRRQHRLLYCGAEAGDAAAGNRVRRSVWPRDDVGAARAAVGRCGRHLPCR